MTRPTPAGDFDYEALRRRVRRAGGAPTRGSRRWSTRRSATRGPCSTSVRARAPTSRPIATWWRSSRRRRCAPSAPACPAVDAVAEALPFDDDAFDAAMAMITIHQWRDVEAGLRELRRVARGPVVVLTFTDDTLSDFWLMDYVPEMIAREGPRMPALSRVASVLGGDGLDRRRCRSRSTASTGSSRRSTAGRRRSSTRRCARRSRPGASPIRTTSSAGSPRCARDLAVGRVGRALRRVAHAAGVPRLPAPGRRALVADARRSALALPACGRRSCRRTCRIRASWSTSRTISRTATTACGRRSRRCCAAVERNGPVTVNATKSRITLPDADALRRRGQAAAGPSAGELRPHAGDPA